jgi:nucleoside-triphosphate--adenylate kinase
MLMFGKPGAGKGTLTLRLAQKYDILTLSTGDLLRQQILGQTEVGKEAEGIIARGGLLPDETILRVISSKLDALQNKVMSIPYSRFAQNPYVFAALDFGWFPSHYWPG